MSNHISLCSEVLELLDHDPLLLVERKAWKIVPFHHQKFTPTIAPTASHRTFHRLANRNPRVGTMTTNPVSDATDEFAVYVEGLTCSFGETKALTGLDLVVPPSTVVGLIGPNGAGKTTAVRILSTLLQPDGGTARVAGFDVTQHPQAVRERIGLTGQYAAVDEKLTGRENLVMIAQLTGWNRRGAKARAGEMLERFDLVDAGDRPVRTYSGGMRRRLDLAASLVISPSILFLDEPTTGLDPRSRGQLWDVIRELVGEGTTLLLTTQYLEEADALAESLVIIDNGHNIAEGTPDELKAMVGGDVIEIVLADPSLTSRAAGLLDGLAEGTIHTDPATGDIAIPIGELTNAIAGAVRVLDDAGIRLIDVRRRRPSLDEVFLTLTGRPAEDEAADTKVRASEGVGQ